MKYFFYCFFLISDLMFLLYFCIHLPISRFLSGLLSQVLIGTGAADYRNNIVRLLQSYCLLLQNAQDFCLFFKLKIHYNLIVFHIFLDYIICMEGPELYLPRDGIRGSAALRLPSSCNHFHILSQVNEHLVLNLVFFKNKHLLVIGWMYVFLYFSYHAKRHLIL